MLANKEEAYMHRCLELARRGSGLTAPNPMVGAVLVYKDEIIGEGWHRKFGEAHAEVNCIHSVTKEDQFKMEKAVLYVSLEPCAHSGKTPPCTDLILRVKIPKVVIGCRDPFWKVNGKGIEKLKKAGVEVLSGILESACIHLNRRFFVFHTQQRPYIILKWAQSANGKIATTNSSRLFISNDFSNRLVHKWRTEEASVLVGTNTALLDDPSLTVRLWKGPQPFRMVLDQNLRLPDSLKLFDKKAQTIVFNTLKQKGKDHLVYQKISKNSSPVRQILESLFQLNIQSVLVEGGKKLLQSFIDEKYWDEARVITNEELFVDHGLRSPELSHAQVESREILFSDSIRYYRNSQQINFQDGNP